MRKFFFVIFLMSLSIGCGSSRLVESYMTDKAANHEVEKVLVVGITAQEKARNKFEHKLANAIGDYNVEAVASIDYFDPLFTISERSEADLQQLEEELLEEGYNAVILSKIISVKDKVSLGQAFHVLSGNFQDFKDDYQSNQIIYMNEEDGKNRIYRTETALYGLSENKTRELIWRGTIDLINPDSLESSVENYVRIVMETLKTEKLISGY